MMHVKLTRNVRRHSEPVKSSSKQQKDNKTRNKSETTRDRKGIVSSQLKGKSKSGFPQFQRRTKKKTVSNFLFLFLIFDFFVSVFTPRKLTKIPDKLLALFYIELEGED